ncbi:MAG: ribosomal protein S18-alanine N-acetyltransferase [Erysipelotrichia bacterium]|nr:ribosomal protein S18-alanine N-acetyltransferase [Erysipelotrichia bacterium]
MIRKMTEQDLNAVLKIEKESFFDYWNREQYLYELHENPYAELYVLVIDDKIIGYYDLWIIFDHAEIANIAISSEWRNKHYGKKLMEDIEEKAIENNCETISLEVRVSNLSAIKLYENSGFITINTKKNYYKTSRGYEDGYFMMKGI